MGIRITCLTSMLLPFIAGATPEAGKEPIDRTPRQVFDSALAAQKKGDHKAFIACFSPEAQKMMAAVNAFGALVQQSKAEGDDGKALKEQYKPVLSALDKHGLGVQATKDLRPRLERGGIELIRELAERIKEPAALYFDLKEAYAKTGPLNRENGGAWEKAELTDIMINGSHARGTFVAHGAGKQSKHPITFVKVGSSWRLEHWVFRGPGR